MKGKQMKEDVKREELVCEHDARHNAAVAAARELMPSEETLYDLADFFKIFGDSTRMSILFAIDKAPMCVCGIAELLGMTKSAVSHQLKILRQSALVTYKKSGKIAAKKLYFLLSMLGLAFFSL